MKYKVEFQVAHDVVIMDTLIEKRVEHLKRQNACNLGNIIASVIDFEEIDSDIQKHKLEVQVFAQKDWIAFKESIKNYIETTQGKLSTFNLIMVGKMLKELESIGSEKTPQGTTFVQPD